MSAENPIIYSESEYANLGYSQQDRNVFLQHHQPEKEDAPYHFHPTVELNVLQNCSMTYSFSGREVHVPEGHICAFWAAVPHSVIHVEGKGTITNVYVTLSELLSWSLPDDFVGDIMGGAVLCSATALPIDVELANQWAVEIDKTNQDWQRLHILEVRARLHRMALEGWNCILSTKNSVPKSSLGSRSLARFEKMLKFIALHYTDKIGLSDVARAGDVSQNYAITLFKRMLGRSVKDYITELRIIHAKMQLASRNSKILTIAMDCGFGSLSTFYLVFQQHTGMSPAEFRSSVRNEKSSH